jgi:glycosyltransferase involved in cell wall biosynthesis
MSSVIVITRNSERSIERCIKSIREQSQQPSEIIVVDSSSNDLTAKIAKRNHVRIVREPILGRGRARNTGIKHSRGKIIVFAPADAYFDRDWLKYLMSSFKDARLAGVAGNIYAANPRRVASHLIDLILRDKPHYATTNIAYRKEVLTEVGGFDARLETADDVELAWRILRAGYKIGYEPRAILYHFHPETIADNLKMQYYLGKWSMIARKLSGESMKRQKLLIVTAPLTIFKHIKEIFKNPLLPPFLYLSSIAYAGGLAMGLSIGRTMK